MIPHKKHPKKQLEKYSLLFFQISLVLVLFITHLMIENVISEKITIEQNKGDEIYQVDTYTPIEFKRYEEPPKKVAQKQTKPVSLDIIKKGEPPKVALPAIMPTAIQPKIFTVLGKGKEEPKKEQPELTKTVYDSRTVIPLFKGCKDISLKENRACFDKKMKKFVQRKFDSQIAEELGLSNGNYRIYTQFIIDEHGDVVDVKVRAPHPSLNKEVEQMIRKLPQFTPGKMGTRNVKVRYILPINFKVD